MKHIRVNKTSDYASEFHLYRVEWRTDRIQFYIDDQLTKEIKPPAGGFSEYFPGEINPWVSGTKLAPFDAPVIVFDENIIFDS